MKASKLKTVLDTNVVISSLWGGKPRRIIELWEKGEIIVVVSQEILDEYFEIFNRFELTEEDIENITILFSRPDKVLHIEPDTRINIIKKDPADNKFIECAIDGNADYIVSGDKHLLALGKYEEIKIVTPNEFIKIILE